MSIMVIDPRGVEWWYWNCICPKHNNMFYRKEVEKCRCPQCGTQFKRIEPRWTTDGYIPKENKFIQEKELEGVEK